MEMVLWLDAQAQDQHPGSRAVLITLLLNTKKESDFFSHPKGGLFLPPRYKMLLTIKRNTLQPAFSSVRDFL